MSRIHVLVEDIAGFGFVMIEKWQPMQRIAHGGDHGGENHAEAEKSILHHDPMSIEMFICLIGTEIRVQVKSPVWIP